MAKAMAIRAKRIGHATFETRDIGEQVDYFQEVVGLALAAVVVGEPIGPWHVAGAALVLAGVALTTRGRARPGPARGRRR